MALNIKLHPKQYMALTSPANEILYGGAVGGGKALALDTPILTVDGWKTMDSIVVGDKVFDENGMPCNVLAKSEVDYDSDTYEVVFDRGHKLICDGRHQWNTIVRRERNSAIPDNKKGKVKTTVEIKNTLRVEEGRANHSIKLAKPLQFPEKKQPLHPYIFGMWLAGGYLIDDRKNIIKQQARAAGTDFQISKYENGKYTDIDTFNKAIEATGVPIDNKYIPDMYLFGSEEQRLNLLQGFVDILGTVDTYSRIELHFVTLELAQQINFIVKSLGMKSNINSEGHKIAGGTNKKGVSYNYRVRFRANKNIVTANRRVKKFNKYYPEKREARRNFYIKEVHKIAPRAKQCIQVDSPSHLYLAGEELIPTHNSFLMRVAAILWAMEAPGLQIYLFRLTRKELEDNHMIGPGGFHELLGDAVDSKFVKINNADYQIQFKNGPHNTYMGGSIIHLCHCQYEKDKYKYQGAEMGVLMIDEATHFTKTKYEFLRSRVRIPKSWEPPKAFEAKWGVNFFPRILLGTNPGGVAHCVRFGRVLTDKGFIDIQNVNIGDYVLSENKDTFKMEYKKVINTFKYDYSGEIVNLRNKKINIEFTPNHKIPYIPDYKKSDYFVMKPFDELPNQANIIRGGIDYVGKHIDSFTVTDGYMNPNQMANNPLTLNHRDYANLMGWWLSEGCVIFPSKTIGVFFISQMKEKQRNDIESLLKRCGFRYSKTNNQFAVYSLDWASYFNQFGKCEEKFVPRELLDSDDIDILFESLMKGDGHWVSQTGGSYTTYSEQLRDDFIEICVKLGYTTHYVVEYREDRRLPRQVIHFHKTKRPVTEVFTGNKRYRNRKESAKHPSNASREYFEGNVYCIEVEDNHNFFLEQNGHLWLSGNSFYRKEFVKLTKPMEIVQMPKSKGGMRRQFIPAVLDDNPSIDKNEYEGKVMSIGNAAMAKMMLEGDWDAVAGGMFDDVWDPKVHMIEPFQIPSSWYVDRAFDWGSAAPFSVGWYAESDGSEVELADGTKYTYPQGTLFRIYEWYGWNGEENEGSGLTGYEIGQGIKDIEETQWVFEQVRRVKPGPADTQIWNANPKYDSAYSSIVQEINAGYYGNDSYKIFDIFVQSDKSQGSNVRGWDLVRTHLKNSLNYPKVDRKCIFFFNTCVHVARTLPIIMRDENRVEEIAKGQEDHIIDEIKYRLAHTKQMTRKIATRMG